MPQRCMKSSSDFVVIERRALKETGQLCFWPCACKPVQAQSTSGGKARSLAGSVRVSDTSRSGSA